LAFCARHSPGIDNWNKQPIKASFVKIGKQMKISSKTNLQLQAQCAISKAERDKEKTLSQRKPSNPKQNCVCSLNTVLNFNQQERFTCR
jgi:hypothetical protein